MAIEPLAANTSSQEATTSDPKTRPTVLLFDSGMGGLSVYQEVRKLLPDLHYIYAFDNEAFPYGEKTEAFIVERVTKIVRQIAQQHPLAVIVIACNTASTITLPALRAMSDIPVVGVVPAIKPAAKLTRNGLVGLLATRATVKRAYTRELIDRFASECQVSLLGSAELVELAERKLYGEAIPAGALETILAPWRNMKEPPDTVVLGCTHFPLIAEELKSALPDGTRLVDSGAAIARRMQWLINNSEKPHYLTAEKNVAYCMRDDETTQKLLPVLQQFGLESLKKLTITG
ncbi:glutamate racemase [Morganella morganii]|nr:glutamate racemase [Morganella morganii]